MTAKTKEQTPKHTKMSKGQKKKKNLTSIHATTPEQNLQNRIKNQEKKAKRLNRIQKRSDSKKTISKFLSNVKSWVADDQNTRSTQSVRRQYKNTYKVFIRHLPPTTTCRALEKHFADPRLNIECIRLFVSPKDEKCLGWAFLEFGSKLETEIAMLKNISRFQGQRITVANSLRNFTPSKKKSQRIIIYRPYATENQSAEKTEENMNTN